MTSLIIYMNILGSNFKKSAVKALMNHNGKSLVLKPKMLFSKHNKILNQMENGGQNQNQLEKRILRLEQELHENQQLREEKQKNLAEEGTLLGFLGFLLFLSLEEEQRIHTHE